MSRRQFMKISAGAVNIHGLITPMVLLSWPWSRWFQYVTPMTKET